MLLILFFLLTLVLIILVFSSFIRKNNKIEPQSIIEPTSDCCGAHSVCEQDTLLSSSNKIVYYDDDELDILIGVIPINFTNEQVKMLSHVFLTLKESDMAGWLRSLQIHLH